MNCENHKKEVAGISDMKQLAEMIGDLHYEALGLLMAHLADKINADGTKDKKEGREKIGGYLESASYDLLEVRWKIEKAWAISKPHMEQKPEPSAEKTLESIYQDQSWHSWKCRCGYLNNRGNGNCGRCGWHTGLDCMFYGKDNVVVHYGVWKPVDNE